MRVLVTGGGGYLGAVLIPKLLARGHEVRVLDLGYFGLGHLSAIQPAVQIVRDDIRRATGSPDRLAGLLDGIDGVVHLAAISNDPSSELNPKLTVEVNLRATKALADACRERRLRFLFSSTCAVYGHADAALNEEGGVAPLTVYARSKVDAEAYLGAIADRDWRPVILRNGTLFGFSNRMRFDLVVNIFALSGALHGRIKVFGEGRQWRPHLHVADCARAFVFFLEHAAPRHLLYNVFHENLRVVDLAAIFSRLLPRLSVEHVAAAEPDERNYRVDKARLLAEGFETKTDVEAGAEALVDAIISGQIQDPESVFYRNAKWLKQLTDLDPEDHASMVTLLDTFARHRTRG